MKVVPEFNPFEGACTERYKKPKNAVKVKLGDHECSCGAFDKYNTIWAKWHDEGCVIHKKKRRR